MYTELKACRICGNTEFDPVLELGTQSLTGVFPSDPEQKVTAGPLELVKCAQRPGRRSCGLLQLRHSYDSTEMYGANYGYRSGLNQSMVDHLHRKARSICKFAKPMPGDLIIDIGSNDSTLLQAYPKECSLVGIDPTGAKFRQYYPEHIRLIPDFFSADLIRRQLGSRKAKIVSSIAMFYDLEAPIAFMNEVREILADDGLWVFEQSYMPTMLDMNAYDTICHEHLEYYALSQICWMAREAGLRIIDVELNNVNGGSFSVVAAKRESPCQENKAAVESILQVEERRGLAELNPYLDFKQRVFEHRRHLLDFLGNVRSAKQTVFGYGASTKGNVILQFCGLTAADIPAIAEVNQDKFGRYTPGSRIPIISEDQAHGQKPDYFLVLPWHFRENLVIRERPYLETGGRLLFPLPRIDVVTA